ncbi:MAG: glycosyltransferase family 9 protein [Phycisphaerales bacterium]
MSSVPTPERILIIRPSALGDVCRTVPVLASLRAAYPSAHIAWLVQRGFEGAVRHHPGLDEVIPFERSRMAVRRWWTRDGRGALLDLVGRLRRERFDLVLDCQGLGRSGALGILSGAPIRVGHRDARELAWLGYTRRVKSDPSRHTVDRMLDLVRAIGVAVVEDMRLYPGEEATRWADACLGASGDEHGVVVLAPTSRWEGKRWPIERFDELASRLLDPSDGAPGAGRVVVVGGPGEEGQCAPLRARAARDPRVIDLVGRISVEQLMGVIGRSDLLVACDSAAAHMGVGMGRPMVALFGPTRIDLVGPYRRAGDVIQDGTPTPGMSHKDASSGRLMMDRIAVSTVLDACIARLRSVGQVGSGTMRP